jgi:hypothetical protein
MGSPWPDDRAEYLCDFLKQVRAGCFGLTRRRRETEILVMDKSVTSPAPGRPAPPGFAGSRSEWLRQAGYRILPLTREACERANALPVHHKDPMDRMLIAAALDRGMTVITDDEVFARFGAATVW